MIHGLLHILGVDDMSGRWYAWWSGSGGDLSILATPLVLCRRHNCHLRGCWRLGRHQAVVDGKPVMLCRKRHPDDHLTAQQVQQGASTP
jgi:hypothetical protein